MGSPRGTSWPRCSRLPQRVRRPAHAADAACQPVGVLPSVQHTELDRPPQAHGDLPSVLPEQGQQLGQRVVRLPVVMREVGDRSAGTVVS